MLKERIYAWYPQVDVPAFTRTKQNYHEIESLYRAASQKHLEKERPQNNEVPPIGFRINRKSAPEEEKELSPAGFLRRCKSAPLGLLSYEEASPRDYADPKVENKRIVAVANEEHTAKPHSQSANAPTVVVNPEGCTEKPASAIPKPPPVNSQSRSVCNYSAVSNFDSKSPTKARPYSASFAAWKKSETELFRRNPSSARTSRQANIEYPANSPTVGIPPNSNNVKNSSSFSKPPSGNSHYRSPCKHPAISNFGPNSFLKVRPFSASSVAGTKIERGQCFRQVSSARESRQVKSEPPTNVVTGPVSAYSNGDDHTSSVSKPVPKSRTESQNSSNSDADRQRNGLITILSSYPYRQRTASADGHSRGPKKNADSNATTKIGSGKPKPSEPANLHNPNPKPTQDETQITDAQSSPGRHQNGNGLEIENRQVVPGVTVVVDDKGNRVNNRAKYAWNKVSRPPEVNAKDPEVNDSHISYAKRANISEVALKEAKEYNREDYNQSLRINGWRMEVHGNQFGLKKPPVRVPYWVPLAVPNVLEQSPVFRPNDPNTFFYNTIPKRTREIKISKHWHSETGYEQRLANTNRKKQGYNYRKWSFVY